MTESSKMKDMPVDKMMILIEKEYFYGSWNA